VDTKSEIREFLTSRRARITPQEAGLASYGSRVRHEDVDAAEPLGGRGGQRLEVARAADIARGGHGSLDSEAVSAPRCEAELDAL
jgi:hypothetical protein